MTEYIMIKIYQYFNVIEYKIHIIMINYTLANILLVSKLKRKLYIYI